MQRNEFTFLQSDHRIGAPLVIAKLYLKDTRGQNIDHSANLSSNEFKVPAITEQGNHIQ